MCNRVPGLISDEAKAQIAADITNAHCDITGTSRVFVHVFFFEDAPRYPINGKSVFIFCNFHTTGHMAQQKTNLVNRIKSSVVTHSGISMNEIVADTTDIPASWVMEGGDVFTGS
jgi:phenylpyruvate tautomerase PptA (4-oxalocrotonate tautomerase family)